MADLEKTVAIIFEGVDQMGAGVDSATRSIDSFATRVQTATQPLVHLTAGVLKFEAAMLTAGVAVTGMAVKLAGDFDTAFREISTLIDAAPEDLARFSDEILAYGRESSLSLETITQSVYNAISAGVDYTDSLAAVAQAERLAIAGKADLDQSLTVLVSSLNAYGLGMDQATHFSDLLFTTVRQGQTTLPELGSSLARVTGLAATAGVGFDELLAAVATLTATGSGTSEAITQIRGAISNILSPAKQARDLAAELGLEFNSAALESQGLEGVLQATAEATGGNVEQMAQLFGSVEALNGVLTLTGLGAEAFADNIEAMGESAGATQEAYEKMVDQVVLGTQRIINAMKGALIGVGQPLLDEFVSIQDAIAAIFNAIGASVDSGQLQGFVDRIEGVFQGIEASLSSVAQNLPQALEQADFSGFFNGLDLIRDAVAGLFDGADLTTVEGLVSIIETLGLGFETLAAYTVGAVEALVPFIGLIIDLATWVLELDPNLVAVVGSIGGAAIALNTLGGAALTITEIIRALAGKNGVVALAASEFRLMAGSLAGTGRLELVGAAGAAIFALQQLYQELQEFNEFRFNFSDSLIEELDQTTGAQRAATEFSLFQVEKIARGYNSLSDFFGWGDEAAADFDVVSEEAIQAALQVDNFARAAAGVEQAVDSTGSAILRGFRSWEQWSEAAESARLRTEAATLAFDTNATTLWDHIDSLDGTSQAWERVGENTYQVARGLGEIDEALRLVQSQFDAGMIDEDTYNEMTRVLEGMRTESDRAAQSQQDLAGEVLNSEEAILAARQAVLDYELELESLASNERIRKIELAVELGIAQLEADTRRFESVMESINTTITSTGELLGGEFGLFQLRFGGDVGRWDQLDLDKQIEAERKARDEAFKLQKEQIEAEIKFMQAKTKALQNGDGLIKIDSDGLEPALEMIMWEIIQKVQLRANAEGAEFLLGIGGTGSSDPDPA